MIIIRNRIIPLRGFSAINLFGLLFVHHGVEVDARLLNHERIHSAQMRELWYIPFYVIYLLEWLWRLPRQCNAYRQISFEQEAYEHDSDAGYLVRRRPMAWMAYLQGARR